MIPSDAVVRRYGQERCRRRPRRTPRLDQVHISERVLTPGLDGLSQWLTRYDRESDG